MLRASLPSVQGRDALATAGERRCYFRATLTEEFLMSSLTLLQSLHESLSTRAQVKSVFGEPIIAGDKTIIPVAKVAYGFGGGTGSGGLEIKTARGEVAGAAAESEHSPSAFSKSAPRGLDL